MLVIDSTKNLQINLANPKTTNDCPWTLSYVDLNATTPTFAPGATSGTSNGTSTVTIMASPINSNIRQLKFFSFYNQDTVGVTISFAENDNSNLRDIGVWYLQVGYTLEYVDSYGFVSLNTLAQIVSSGLVGSQGAQGPTGYNQTQQILTFAPTITWNVSNGQNAQLTMSGNATLSMINEVAGSYYTVIVSQDATGSHILTPPSGSKGIGGASFSTGGTFSLSTSGTASDILSAYFDGTTNWWTYGTNFT
jgi:hypothetical protein